MPTRTPWPLTCWPLTLMFQASWACVSCSASDSSGAAAVAVFARGLLGRAEALGARRGRGRRDRRSMNTLNEGSAPKCRQRALGDGGREGRDDVIPHDAGGAVCREFAGDGVRAGVVPEDDDHADRRLGRGARCGRSGAHDARGQRQRDDQRQDEDEHTTSHETPLLGLLPHVPCREREAPDTTHARGAGVRPTECPEADRASWLPCGVIGRMAPRAPRARRPGRSGLPCRAVYSASTP